MIISVTVAILVRPSLLEESDCYYSLLLLSLPPIPHVYKRGEQRALLIFGINSTGWPYL